MGGAPGVGSGAGGFTKGRVTYETVSRYLAAAQAGLHV